MAALRRAGGAGPGRIPSVDFSHPAPASPASARASGASQPAAPSGDLSTFGLVAIGLNLKDSLAKCCLDFISSNSSANLLSLRLKTGRKFCMSRGILGAAEQLLEAGLAGFIRHKRGLSEHVTARTCLPPPSLESTISCFFSDFKLKSVLFLIVAFLLALTMLTIF